MADAPQEQGLPDTPIIINGKTYQIRFGLRAILALKRKWNLADQRAVQAYITSNKEDLEVMVTVVWAALQTHHRDLSEDQVLDMLDGGDLSAITGALVEAMAAAQPPPADPK